MLEFFDVPFVIVVFDETINELFVCSLTTKGGRCELSEAVGEFVRCGVVFPLKFAALVEDFDGVVFEPHFDVLAIVAIVDKNLIDRYFAAKIELPPFAGSSEIHGVIDCGQISIDRTMGTSVFLATIR